MMAAGAMRVRHGDGCWGVAYNRSLLPDCHTSRTSSRTAKVPTAIGFVRPVRLVRLILKNRARRSAAIGTLTLPTAIRTVTPTLATCQGSTPKPTVASSLTCA